MPVNWCIENLSFELDDCPHNAEYDMASNSPRGPCEPGTRTEILQELMEWVESGNTQFYWMNGTEGTGKTAIAWSLCQILADAKLLGASFFGSRLQRDCKDIRVIFPRIATQLARRYPAFRESLKTSWATLEQNSNNLRCDLRAQLHELIISPWDSCGILTPERIVVVIDALDECEGNHAMFLQVLLDNVAKLPFRVLITSRPDLSICTALAGIKMHSPDFLSTFVLHEIEGDVVQRDILRFVKSHLSHLIGWDIISLIVNLSGTLFLYAATIVRVLIVGKVDIHNFIQVLNLPPLDNGEEPQPLVLLDDLWRRVLMMILSNDPESPESSVPTAKDILYTIVSAREPLTRQVLVGLWSVPEPGIVQWLELLRPIVFVTHNPEHLLIAYHTSLSDFLLDSSRSKEYGLELQLVNAKITSLCLGVMSNHLRHNLCNLAGRPFNEAIPPNIVSFYISPTLRYSSISWIDHWILSAKVPPVCRTIFDGVHSFITTHLFHWFECLSLLGSLPTGLEGLARMLDTLVADRNFSGLAVLIYHSLRFIQQTYDSILQSAMEVYWSALIWIPTQSPLRVYYAAQTPHVIPQILGGLPKEWAGPIRVINARSSQVTSLSFSWDGCHIVFGSMDGSIGIWNLQTQKEELRFFGHTREVSSVAMFRDKHRALSGSLDGAVHIWDMGTGEVLLTLQDESLYTGCFAVTLSSNEKWLASGHDDNRIRIWDVVNGMLAHLPLEGHQGTIRSISFAENSTQLASFSTFGPIFIWDVQSGEKLHTFDRLMAQDPNLYIRTETLQVLLGHSNPVFCAVFLPSRTQEVPIGTLSIVDISTQNIIHTLTGVGRADSIAVSPDGRRIVTGRGRDITFWSARSEFMEERRYIDAVPSIRPSNSIALSSNGQRVLMIPSASILDTATLEEIAVLDPSKNGYSLGSLSISGEIAAVIPNNSDPGRKIEVWRLPGTGVSRSRLAALQPHGRIYGISFSHDERRLVAAGFQRVKLWDIGTGQSSRTFQHSSLVFHAIFSHDDTRVLSATNTSAHLWDAQSGEQLNQLNMDSPILNIAFTPDDQYIISYHQSGIKIWNAQTSKDEHTYEGYHYWATLQTGSSYALHEDGWLYCFPQFDAPPHKVVWIPSPYRPPMDFPGIPFAHLLRWRAYGTLISLCSEGIRLCLPREDGFISLLIPRDG